MKETERKVLAEIQGLGVPVQILANKADRLQPDERAAVLAHVREGLAAVGLRSQAEPLAFSARLSLKGRLGDADALAASGWPEVEALLSERIVDASEALRERALRRRARGVADELAAAAAGARGAGPRGGARGPRAARGAGSRPRRASAASGRRSPGATDQAIEPGARRRSRADLQARSASCPRSASAATPACASTCASASSPASPTRSWPSSSRGASSRAPRAAARARPRCAPC